VIYRLLDWLRHQARLRRWTATRATGRRGEDLAHRHLRRQGYTVVARNYATRSLSGEVDLIGWDGPVLAFVEVKTRHSEEFGSPDRAVDSEKQHRLRIAAMDYARHAGVDWDQVRFDVVSIVLENPVRLTLVRDAFSTR
jgi:putative endonuclease